MLPLSADIGDLGTEYKSGVEQWRLLILDYGKTFAYNKVSVVEMVRNVDNPKAIAELC